VSRTSRELELKWEVPESNGASLERYDLLGGSNLRLLHWATLTTSFLETTVSSDKLFNTDGMEKEECGVLHGEEQLAELFCDTAVYAPLDAASNTFKLGGLLPGQNYYFLYRAVGGAGKGSLSNISGPFTTGSEEPCPVEAPYILTTTESTCQVVCHLPYNMGSPIKKIMVNWTRISGPLARKDLDPVTGMVADHLSSGMVTFEVASLGVAPSPPGGQKQVDIAGLTEALLRSYRDECCDDEYALTCGHEPTFGWVTCREYVATLNGLMPGTRYEVKWKCCNGEGKTGWTDWADPVVFVTQAQKPDTPELLIFVE
jgi:hypothetical protein